MKYQLTMRSRPVAAESVQDKHERLRSALAQLPNGGSLGAEEWPAVKEPGTEAKTDVRLDKPFGGRARGRISYQNRKYTPDAAMYDDYLTLDFDPKKIDFKTLATDYLQRYVEAFRAYRGHAAD